jgi:ATP-dependent DNA helicase RecQ
LYFNSKYARTGYSYVNEKGKEILASLPDITNNGKEDNIKWVWKFIEIVDEDPKAGQINNIKHLRGACVRMLSNQPDSYTLLLLNAFTLYMLEYNNLRYLKEAENIILHAFTQIIEKEIKWNENKIEEIYNQFTEIILNKNPQLKVELVKHNLMFDLNNIMLKNYLQPILNAKATLIKLNEILN